MCKTNFKVSLIDSRSYGGDLVGSDHKPVVARFKLDCKFIIHKKRSPIQVKYDLNNLASSDTKSKFHNTFEDKMNTRVKTDEAPNELKSLFEDLNSSALEVIGKLPPRKHHQYTNDSEIMKMSTERKSF